jgi:hypothetical protein
MVNWICGVIMLLGLLAVIPVCVWLRRLERQSQRTVEAIRAGERRIAALTAEVLGRTPEP